MTAADLPAFTYLLKRLGLAFNAKFNDLRTDVFFDALESFPFTTVQHAALALERTSARFPTPAAFREAARHLPPTTRPALPAHFDPRTGPWCPSCDDTGWQPTTRHGPHGLGSAPAVTPCPCRPSNLVYQYTHT